jgi:hypothetical protein
MISLHIHSFIFRDADFGFQNPFFGFGNRAMFLDLNNLAYLSRVIGIVRFVFFIVFYELAVQRMAELALYLYDNRFVVLVADNRSLQYSSWHDLSFYFFTFAFVLAFTHASNSFFFCSALSTTSGIAGTPIILLYIFSLMGNISSINILQDLRRKGHYFLHVVFSTRFAGYRAEDARSNRLKIIFIYQDDRIVVKADYAAVRSAHRKLCSDDNRALDGSFLHFAARNGAFYRDDDFIADRRIPSVRSAQHFYAQALFRAAVIRNI